MRNYFILSILVLTTGLLQAQMEVNGDILYGNEWINYSDEHTLELKILEEGMYQVSYSDLVAQGIPAGLLIGNDIQLLTNGKHEPLYMSSEGAWGQSDYLLFYGKPNDGYLDQFMYGDPENEQLNTKVSIFSDAKSYFLRIRENASFTSRYEMQPNNLSGQLPQLQTYYMHTEAETFQEATWFPAVPNDPNIHFSHFITGEGFATRFRPTTTIELPVSNVFTSGPEPRLRIRTGSNNSDISVELQVNNNPILNEVYNGTQVKEYDLEFDKAFLKDNTNYIKAECQSVADNIGIAFIELIYPRRVDANNQGQFWFQAPNDNFQAYFEVPKFNASGRNLVFDLENKQVLEPVMEGNVAKFVLPARQTPSSKTLLINSEQYLTPSSIDRVTFQDFSGLNPEYLILTSELLNSSENGQNVIEAYEAFRSSAAGGEYKTAVINVEDLYDQFGYGVDKHSMAIRNFGQYVKDLWPDFQMVNIIGKGLAYSNKNRETMFENYVPTYGRPGSDNLLFASPGKTYPYVGVGRIAAHQKEDVINYMEKAKIHAALSDIATLSIEDRLWLKNVLHLSGGDSKIWNRIFNALESMRHIVEDNKYGACVTTFKKNSSDPVTTALTQDILNTIDEGVSMLTFFGHSSASGFDFSVEDPRKYNNQGKLPVVISMGCHSGDIHESIFSLSEEFILTKDLGAIAFIAASGNAYIDPLHQSGLRLYDKIGASFYGQPVSLAVRSVMEDMHERLDSIYQQGPKDAPFDISYSKPLTLLEQNTFHGDPAIEIFSAEAPDYVVDLKTLETIGTIGSQDTEINLAFEIRNLGAGGDVDSLNNMLIHGYGNGLADTIYFTTIAPKNKAYIEMTIPHPGRAALAKNTLNIVLDIDNKVAEYPDPDGELNNELKYAWSLPQGFCFYIFDNSAMPIYPKDFGIVSDPNVNLRASALNALGAESTYFFQIDTSELFNSPLVITEEVISGPAVIQWQPTIDFQEATTYYWRVKPKGDERAIWNGRSFIYLENGSPGWNQSHFYQWTKDEYENSLIDSTSRDFQFVNNITDIRIKNVMVNIGKPGVTYQNSPTEYLDFFDELRSGVYMATFDGSTGIARVNDHTQNGEFGSFVAAQWVENFICYPYATHTPEERKLAIDFIEEVVPDGDYIAFFTIQRANNDYQPEEWASDNAVFGTDLMTLLESYGAAEVRNLADEAVPYIFVFKKNDNAFTPIEIKAESSGEEISVELKIQGKWFEGTMESTVIGPSNGWEQLLWNMDLVDLAEDEYRLDLIGINADGDEATLYENIDEFVFNLSDIDASEWPYLKLQLYLKDETSRTPAQMDYWRIMYQGLPEAILDINQRFTFKNDTLSQGDNFIFESMATNISEVDMDSLLVKYTITDQNNETFVFENRLAPLAAQQSIDLEFEYDTHEVLGVNEFRVEINAEREQIEEHYFNNIGIREFMITGDNTNPLIDLTFDGVRIMDGDIVSPMPLIVVTLKDENFNFPINDVSSFDLALQQLPDMQSYPVDLTSEDVTFFPADSSNNYCARLEFTPTLESGEYILYVQGEDASGNLSGDQAITASFVVFAETAVTNVLNYPNPFSTSTEFVYTITGTEVPEVFTIQIMTLSGKVVKEITKEELGVIRVGQNRSDYKWDGTDDFGSRLANGVYLYRVITSDSNGDAIDVLPESSLDSYFKKGFGKLVIMR